MPIVIGDASNICAGLQYIDRNGDTQTGTKDCGAVTTKNCSTDGEIACMTTAQFKAADVASASTKILSGQTLAGISGEAAPRPADCANDGDAGCVVVGPSFAAAATTGAASKILSGQTLAGVPGNVTLPAAGKVYTGITYGVSGTGSTGTLTLPSATNVLSGSGTYGDPGAAVTPTLANKGSWDLTTTFPGAGYYSGTTNTPTATTIASGTTIIGVAGSGTLESHSNCSANGQQSCVASGTYFAGTACTTDGSNCFLPTYSIPGLQTKKAIDFATIDSSKMLDSLTVSGVVGTIASKGAWNLTMAFPGIGYYTSVSNTPTAPTIASGTTIIGVAGSATLESHSNCAADGVTGCVTTASYKSADMTTAIAGNIKSGATIAGVAGSVTAESHSNCASDGATGCVAVATYPAALVTGAASKILSGQTLAGVAGNVTLPAVGKVYTGITYGVSGTGSTGTLTLPSAANVLSGSGTYGDPGAAVTPTLSNKGSWDLTTAFPGVGYYSGTTNTPTATTIASGTTIIGVAGSATLSPANCSSNGQQSCVASGTYFAGTACAANSSGCYLPTYVVTTQPLKAISYDTINSNAANIRASATLGGVTGTLADCAANAATGCVTTAAYKSADLTNLSAGNIKSGVTIAGTAGQYPNATYPLTGSSGTDLTSATFNAQIKSSATFQYFGSDGTRNTGTGDANLTAANIANGVSIFGSTGTYQGVAPDPWNVRVGATVNGVTGKLKVSCRNRANPTLFDIDAGQAATVTIGSPGVFNITNHGLTNGTMVRLNFSSAPSGLNGSTTYYVVNALTDTFNLSSASAGTAINITSSAGVNVMVHKWQASPQSIDVWDTTDDYNGSITGLPPNTVAAWTSDTDCGGVETVAGDANVWRDVTTTAAGAASDCATDGTRCTMQDKITGLWWSKRQSSSNWWQAVANCQDLNYNGQTGWRLPTQKELMEAGVHGMRSAVSTNWITDVLIYNYLWSSTTQNTIMDYAWAVNPSNGRVFSMAKSGTSNIFLCVR